MSGKIKQSDLTATIATIKACCGCGFRSDGDALFVLTKASLHTATTGHRIELLGEVRKNK